MRKAEEEEEAPGEEGRGGLQKRKKTARWHPAQAALSV